MTKPFTSAFNETQGWHVAYATGRNTAYVETHLGSEDEAQAAADTWNRAAAKSCRTAMLECVEGLGDFARVQALPRSTGAQVRVYYKGGSLEAAAQLRRVQTNTFVVVADYCGREQPWAWSTLSAAHALTGAGQQNEADMQGFTEADVRVFPREAAAILDSAQDPFSLEDLQEALS